MKTVEVYLGYWKKGDDLAFCVDEVGNNAEAILEHSNMLMGASWQLNEIYKILQGKEIDICADTHYIAIECDDEAAQQLVDKDLVEFPEDWDEDEE